MKLPGTALLVSTFCLLISCGGGSTGGTGGSGGSGGSGGANAGSSGGGASGTAGKVYACITSSCSTQCNY